MRIAYISNSFSKGGAASGNNSVVKILEDLGYSVDRYEFSSISWRQKPFRSIGLWPIILFYYVLGKAFNEKLSSTFGFFDYEDFQKYDVIFLGHLSNSIVNISSFVGKENVFWRHSDLWAKLKIGHYKDPIWCFGKTKLIKEKLFSSTKNIFPSIWIKQELNAHDVIPYLIFRNFADSVVCSEELDQHFTIPGLGFSAASLGDKRKGFKHFCHLANMCDSQFSYIAAGRGSVRMPNNITHLSHLNKTEMREFYKSIDIIFILSSVDNSPNVLVEALSNGVFPIVIPGSGAAELLTEAFGQDANGKTYLYYNPPDDSVDGLKRYILANIRRLRDERFARMLQFEKFRTETITHQSNVLKKMLEAL